MNRRFKMLNLYAGVGGNRKLWPKNIDVTAVEIDEDIASIYSDLYPNDKLIIGDAHSYLQKHYYEYDGIWTSPPCQSHSSFRQNISVRFRGTPAIYPDMSLYQEIIFLKYNFKGLWVVENVKPYYEYLINPDAILQRHAYWKNFNIEDKEFPTEKLRSAQIPDLQVLHGINLDGYKLKNKRQVLRNCVGPEIGLHIFKEMMKARPLEVPFVL